MAWSLDVAGGPRHREGVDQQLVIASLRESCLFARAEDRALAEISSQLRRRRFRRNETIFHQGDPGDSLHIVSTGAVKITLPRLEGERPSSPPCGAATTSESWPSSTVLRGRRPQWRWSRPRR